MEDVDEKGKQTGTKALLLQQEELWHTSVHLSSIQHINLTSLRLVRGRFISNDFV